MNAVPDATRRRIAHATLVIPSALRVHCGGADALPVAATTVRTALAAAGRRYPALQQHILTRDGALRPFVNVFLHQRDVRDLDGLDTPLADGDALLIVPAVAGG